MEFGGDELMRVHSEETGGAMTDKEKTLAMFRRLPNDITINQGIYHLHVLSKIEQGLKESGEGLGKDHDELMAELEIEYGEEKGGLAAPGGSRSPGNRSIHSQGLPKKRSGLSETLKNGRKKT
jgi:hypothetical protein